MKLSDSEIKIAKSPDAKIDKFINITVK
jgi:hypothetical protein